MANVYDGVAGPPDSSQGYTQLYQNPAAAAPAIYLSPVKVLVEILGFTALLPIVRLPRQIPRARRQRSIPMNWGPGSLNSHSMER